MTYFDEKPFVLQLEFKGDWFTSDYFSSVADALTVAKMKVTPWRIIRHSTGAVVNSGNPVYIHTTTSVCKEFDIFDWNRWLHHASILQLQVEVSLLEDLIVLYAEIWEKSEGEQRDKAAAKAELFDNQRHAAHIEIQKRLQSQYVALCEN